MGDDYQQWSNCGRFQNCFLLPELEKTRKERSACCSRPGQYFWEWSEHVQWRDFRWKLQCLQSGHFLKKTGPPPPPQENQNPARQAVCHLCTGTRRLQAIWGSNCNDARSQTACESVCPENWAARGARVTKGQTIHGKCNTVSSLEAMESWGSRWWVKQANGSWVYRHRNARIPFTLVHLNDRFPTMKLAFFGIYALRFYYPLLLVQCGYIIISVCLIFAQWVKQYSGAWL